MSSSETISRSECPVVRLCPVVVPPLKRGVASLLTPFFSMIGPSTIASEELPNYPMCRFSKICILVASLWEKVSDLQWLPCF